MIPTSWGWLLFSASLESAIWVALAWPLARFVRRFSPDASVWIWRLVLAKMLLSVIGFGMPFFRLSTSASPEGSAWAAWLVLTATSLGGTIVLASLGGELLRIRKICRGAASSPAASQGLLQDSARLFSLHKPPRLVVGSDGQRPALAGLVSSVLILPRDLPQKMTREEIRLVLLHELAHLRRKDLLWGLLPCLVQVVYFYFPPLWLALRELNVAQECACDREVVRQGRCRPSDYARVLIKSASATAAAPPMAFSASMSAHGKQLAERIQALEVADRPSPKWIKALVVSFAFSTCLRLFGTADFGHPNPPTAPARAAPVGLATME